MTKEPLIDFVQRALAGARKATIQDACSFIAALAFVSIVAAYIG